VVAKFVHRSCGKETCDHEVLGRWAFRDQLNQSTDKAQLRESVRREKSRRGCGSAKKIRFGTSAAYSGSVDREHYLSGEATGTWNQASEEAMRRYQADNGWQSKEVPDRER